MEDDCSAAQIGGQNKKIYEPTQPGSGKLEDRTMLTSDEVQKRNAFAACAAFRIEGLRAAASHNPEWLLVRGDASSRIADACAWPGLTRDAGFFAKASFTQKATPFIGRTIFGQVFVREGMTEISK